MERLTKFDYENYRALKPKQDVVDKLGELEDVLEEFELTSAEDLRNYLNFKTNMAIWEGELNYKNKISDLEQQLHDLPKKIVEEISKELKSLYKNYPIIYSEDKDIVKSCYDKDSVNKILDAILKKYGGEDE